MILSYKVRRLELILGVSVVLSLFALVFGSAAFILPQAISSLVRPMHLTLLLSVFFAPLSALCVRQDVQAVESVAVRALGLVDCLVVLTLVGPAVLAACLAWLQSVSGSYELVRDSTFFVGVGLIGSSLFNPRVGGALGVIYFIACSTTGLDGSGGVRWWAWLRADPSLLSTVPSLLTLALGVYCLRFLGRRVAARKADSTVVPN